MHVNGSPYKREIRDGGRGYTCGENINNVRDPKIAYDIWSIITSQHCMFDLRFIREDAFEKINAKFVEMHLC